MVKAGGIYGMLDEVSMRLTTPQPDLSNGIMQKERAVEGERGRVGKEEVMARKVDWIERC